LYRKGTIIGVGKEFLIFLMGIKTDFCRKGNRKRKTEGRAEFIVQRPWGEKFGRVGAVAVTGAT